MPSHFKSNPNSDHKHSHCRTWTLHYLLRLIQKYWFGLIVLFCGVNPVVLAEAKGWTNLKNGNKLQPTPLWHRLTEEWIGKNCWGIILAFQILFFVLHCLEIRLGGRSDSGVILMSLYSLNVPQRSGTVTLSSSMISDFYKNVYKNNGL